jgi:hypothetical protein
MRPEMRHDQDLIREMEEGERSIIGGRRLRKRKSHDDYPARTSRTPAYGMFSAPFSGVQRMLCTPEPQTIKGIMSTLLIVLLVLLLLAAVPAWPHSRGWGYGPSGIVGLLVLILLIMLLTGRL